MKIELEPHELTALMESVEARVRANMPTPPPVPDLPFSHSQLSRLSTAFKEAYQGNKISAIKIVREVTGLGLKDAKDLVEGNYKY